MRASGYGPESRAAGIEELKVCGGGGLLGVLNSWRREGGRGRSILIGSFGGN